MVLVPGFQGSRFSTGTRKLRSVRNRQNPNFGTPEPELRNRRNQNLGTDGTQEPPEPRVHKKKAGDRACLLPFRVERAYFFLLDFDAAFGADAAIAVAVIVLPSVV